LTEIFFSTRQKTLAGFLLVETEQRAMNCAKERGARRFS